MGIVEMLYAQTERNRKWKIQDGGPHPRITFILACTQVSNESACRPYSIESTFQWLLPCFSRSSNLIMLLLELSVEVANQGGGR